MAIANDKKARTVMSKKDEMAAKMTAHNPGANFSPKSNALIKSSRKIVNGKMPKSDWLT